MVQAATREGTALQGQQDSEGKQPPSDPQRSHARGRTFLRRALRSPFLLTLAVLAAFEGGTRAVNPLRAFNDAGFTTSHYNFLVAKLPPMLDSTENADVLLLGSSGVLIPSVRCDDNFHHRRTRFDKPYFRKIVNSHTRADYLASLLSRAAGRNVTVANTAVAGGVASDEWLIASRYLATGKRPKLAILCVAPREFYDNTRADVEHTATATILADYRSLPERIAACKSPMDALDDAMALVSHFYETRGDYKAVMCALVAQATGHPVDLYSASLRTRGLSPAATISRSQDSDGKGRAGAHDSDRAFPGARGDTEQPVYKQPPNTLRDLDEYKQMYLPVNQKQFKTQSAYLQKLLSLFKQKNIPLLVVDLPITSENAALLPAQALQQYRRMLSSLCNQNSVPLDLVSQQQSFSTANDFEDSVHMNHFGGDKLFRSIADAVRSAPALVQALK